MMKIEQKLDGTGAEAMGVIDEERAV